MVFGQTKNISRRTLFSVAIFFSLVLVLSAMPTPAHAFWGISFGDDIVKPLTQLLVGAITFIPAFIFFLVAGVTNWIIGVTINIGVIPGAEGTPTFVKFGWEFSRQFVNMFFLLILVFIGLATILRLKEYELQKTLPKLIIVALLVNFSAVLVGFVADVGNLMTRFFLDVIGSFGATSFTDIFTQGSETVNSIFGVEGGNAFSNALSALTFGLVLAFFFAFSAFAYAALAIIFFIRLIVLWTLVIMAPFAFAFSILPATQSWWSKWIGALTQWAFVTIPIGFFMFLSNMILKNPVFENSTPLAVGGLEESGALSNIMAQMISPIAAIILLFIGISIATSIAPGVVGSVLKKVSVGAVWKSRAAQRLKGKTAGMLARRGGLHLAARQFGRLGAAGSNLDERANQSTNRIQKWGRKTGAKAMKLGGFTGRSLTGGAQRGLMQYEEKQRPVELPPGFAKWDPKRQGDYINSMTNSSDRFQAGKILADNGTLRLASPAFQSQYEADARRSLNDGDAFEQDERNAYYRAYPEALTENGDLRRRLQRAGVSKSNVDKIIKGREDGKPVDEAGLEKLKVDGNRQSIARTIASAEKKYEEARELITTGLQHTGEPINAALDIEYGLEHNLITKADVEADRTIAAGKVKTALTTQGKWDDYDKKGREGFLRDTAATTSFVRDNRAQYTKNVADFGGDDLGRRVGFASSSSQHIRNGQTEFGREAIDDILQGAGGVNDLTNTPEKLKKYAKTNPQMFSFFMDSVAGREFPVEGRNHMVDVYNRPTTNTADFKKLLRVEDLAAKGPALSKMQGLFQRMHAIQEGLTEAHKRGAAPGVIRTEEARYKNLEDQILILKASIARSATVKSAYPNIEREIQELESLMK
jgi:hypothetical protein